jgi:DNA-binding NarL/FixJ family response regulator
MNRRENLMHAAMLSSRSQPQGAAAEAPRIRVLVVDDHEVVREGLLAALAADGRFEVIAAVPTAAAALAVANRTRPDVALVDLRLPDLMGDRLCAELRQRLPATAVVLLSSYVSEDTMRAAMEAGASAYITKGAGLSELRQTLVDVVAGEPGPPERRILEQLHDLVSRRGGDTRLTPQQERVLELSAEGLTYREIGARLFISESTVRFHMQKLKSKFNARTKTELIARAIRTGAMPPAAEALGSAK